MTNIGAWLRGHFGGKASDPTVPVSSARTGPPLSDSFVDANNAFAFAMYERLRQQQGNLFFSPFGIRTVLGMAHTGAKGETAAQIGQALRIPSSDEKTLQVTQAAMIERLNAASGGRYEMVVANSIWAQDGSPLLPVWLDLATSQNAGGLNRVDFRREADSARMAINRWVEHKTNRRIRDLISPGGVNTETRLVLANAIYFKGRWVFRFRRAATHDEPFWLGGGKSVTTPLMSQQEEVLHMQADGYQAVELSYEGGDLSMLVLLPDDDDGLPELETRLSPRVLREAMSQMRLRKVMLFLPRFTITWGTANMGSQLAALGMTHAFDPSKADFSGINGFRPPHQDALFISALYHKAFVEVTEEGTEAAAASSVVMTLGAAPSRKSTPVPVFRADHPFLFAIRDRNSGAILFLGRMVDPTKAAAPSPE
jgi:serpin B